MSDQPINPQRSTAYVDKRGKYHPCPFQQPYGVAIENGLGQPRDMGQAKHFGGRPGYCSLHLRLGCMDCK